MKPIIEVENLSKKYRLGEIQPYYSLRDDIANLFRNPFSKNNELEKQEFWALKDVSFKVDQGEVLGVIGPNGAGKSTLLKVLSRITPPTSGKAILRGRVASLLEVGTGFNPELTGRENIYLNGAILGMTRREIRKKFNEIVDFSGVEQFLDTPVKRYSSGMYVRLAFAVAAHLESEILLIDEVLSVGDAEFQKRSLGKMNEAAKGGRTVLFVSHNLQAIKSLCKRALLLKKGDLNYSGFVNETVEKYINRDFQRNIKKTWNDMKRAPGNEFIKVKSAEILSNTDVNKEIWTVETPLSIIFEFWNLIPTKINLSLVLWSMTGECIFNVVSDVKKLKKGLYKSTCNIPANLLNDNIYYIQIIFIKDLSIGIYVNDNILSFEIHDVKRIGSWYGKWVGAVRPKLEIGIKSL